MKPSRFMSVCGVITALSCGSPPGPTDSAPVAGLRIIAGDDQIQVPGATLFAPLVVQLVDASGQIVRQGGFRIDWILTASAGSLVVHVDTTNAQGLATARWTLGAELGTQRMEAATIDLPAVEFTARARLPGPIVFVSGRTGLIGNDFEGYPGELYVMDEDGSNIMPLSSASLGVRYDSDPKWSPDGQTVLFARQTGRPAGGTPGLLRAGIHKVDMGTLAETQAPRAGFPAYVNFYREPVWSPDGFEIAAHLDTSIGTQNIPPDISPGQIHIMNREGIGEDPIPSLVPRSSSPDWSLVTDRLVFVCADIGSGQGICAMDPDGNNFTQLTTTGADDDDPRWSPNGSRVLFVRDRANDGGVWIVDADGGNLSQVMPGSLSSPAWAPDGLRFLITVETATTQDIHIVDLATGVSTNLTNSQFRDRDPHWR